MALYRILPLSDLHLQESKMHGFGDKLKFDGVDTVVIAGDTSDSWRDSFHWIGNKIVPKVRQVIHVNGNHDFFGGSLIGSPARMQALADSLRFIHGDDIVYEDTKFKVQYLISTLWTDFAISSLDGRTDQDAQDYARKIAFHELREAMPEYRDVDFDDLQGDIISRRMRPQDAYACHQASKAFLEAELTKPYDGRRVIVTHHAPHRNSIAPVFRDSKLNPAFASDLSAMIERFQPDVWIHGHVHNSSDYWIKNTRVVCNPRGVANSNKEFDWRKIIEIDAPLRSGVQS